MPLRSQLRNGPVTELPDRRFDDRLGSLQRSKDASPILGSDRRDQDAIGPGVAPALSGPTRSAPPASIHARLPPPAPTDSMSMTGMAIGKVSITASVVQVGSPLGRAEKSALVPPMSKVTRFLDGLFRDKATAAATPPAGPLSTKSTGRRATAEWTATPPPDFITKKSFRIAALNSVR